MAQRFRADEAGYSLVELMIVASMLVVVLGAVLSLGEAVQRSTPKDLERAHSIRNTQVGLNRMTRELRQSHALVSHTDYVIEVKTWFAGQERQVRYDCSASEPGETGMNRCIREEVGSSASYPVISRILNGPSSGSPSPVFTYTTNPAGEIAYVKVAVEASTKGHLKQGFTHRAAFHDGFYMRNRDG